MASSDPDHISRGLIELERLANTRSPWRPGDRVLFRGDHRCPGIVTDVGNPLVPGGPGAVDVRWDRGGGVCAHPDNLTALQP